MTDEGVIKFKCSWRQGPPAENTAGLCAARDELRQHGFVGVDKQGIGYGNISLRRAPGFLITGSQTGSVEKLGPEHISHVTSFDISKNSVTCVGPAQASSESMSHAALYLCDASIGAVVHVHSNPLWVSVIDELPTTSRKVPYGTPQMAEEIARLYRESELAQKKLLVMGGHQDGIITFGRSLDDCLTTLFEICDRYRV